MTLRCFVQIGQINESKCERRKEIFEDGAAIAAGNWGHHLFVSKMLL
jgi:hypothetical protein